MSRALALGIAVVTLLLIGIAWLQSGGVERRRIEAAQHPDEAVRFLLSEVQGRRWAEAHDRLANSADIDLISNIKGKVLNKQIVSDECILA